MRAHHGEVEPRRIQLVRIARGVLGAVMVAATLSCGEDPAEPELLVPEVVGSLVGSTPVGSDGFSFLPPLGTSAGSGKLDRSLRPAVEICALTDGACGDAPLVAWQTGAGLDVHGSHFAVNWKPDRTGAVAGQAYRIGVRLHGVRLGYVDVRVVADDHAAAGDLPSVPIHRSLPIKFRIEAGTVAFGSADIGTAGGSLEVGDVRLTVPAGALSGTATVEILGTETEETRLDFAASAPASGAEAMAPPEVRVRLGSEAPVGPVQLTLPVPGGFRADAGSVAMAFSLLWQDGGEEILDTFEPIGPAAASGAATVTVELAPEYFTDRRRPDAGFEAVVVVGSVPAPASPSGAPGPGAPPLYAMSQGGSLCQAPHYVRPPLDPPVVKTSDFSASAPRHLGVDLRAADSTAVYSGEAGRVEYIGWDERPLQRADPRSGKKVKGWGRYVVIRHPDGWFTLYAHLVKSSTDSLAVGDSVSAGDMIALSDNTGGSSGPHLHLEYMSGWGTTNRNQVDPWPCISAVDSLAVAPRADSVRIGDQLQLASTAFDADGSELEDAVVSWVSRSPALATVDATGLVTGVARGTVRIVATSGPAADSATLQIVPTQPTYDSYDGTWYFTVPEPNLDPPVRNWHPNHKVVIDGWYGYEAEYNPELGEWVTSAPTLQTVDRWNGYLYLFTPGRRIRFYGPWTETSIGGTYSYYIQHQEYTVNVTYTRAPTP